MRRRVSALHSSLARLARRTPYVPAGGHVRVAKVVVVDQAGPPRQHRRVAQDQVRLRAHKKHNGHTARVRLRVRGPGTAGKKHTFHCGDDAANRVLSGLRNWCKSGHVHRPVPLTSAAERQYAPAIARGRTFQGPRVDVGEQGKDEWPVCLPVPADQVVDQERFQLTRPLLSGVGCAGAVGYERGRQTRAHPRGVRHGHARGW